MAFLGEVGDLRAEGQTQTALFFDDGLVLLRGAGPSARAPTGAAVGDLVGGTLSSALHERRRQVLAGLDGSDGDAASFAASRRQARLVPWSEVTELRLEAGPRGTRQIVVARAKGARLRLAGRAADLDAASLRALLGRILGDRLVVTAGE